MSNLHDAGARELLELWALLDADGRMRLLDFARWLFSDSRLRGGPFDGLRIPERFKDKSDLSIEIGGRAALYSTPGDGELTLRFDGFHRIGGEGGTWPDISADDLREMGANHE